MAYIFTSDSKEGAGRPDLAKAFEVGPVLDDRITVLGMHFLQAGLGDSERRECRPQDDQEVLCCVGQYGPADITSVGCGADEDYQKRQVSFPFGKRNHMTQGADLFCDCQLRQLPNCPVCTCLAAGI